MREHAQLFHLLNENIIVESVTEAFDKLNSGIFKDIPLSAMNTSKQVICGLFHELIVHEISKQPHWRAGKPKIEADLVHANGLQLQVKTSSSQDGIAGNRYASENEYSDPSEYYICVNFTPFTAITKIRAGFLPSSSWKPQSGKGNAATLKKEILDILPFLAGPYLQKLPFYAVHGIGEKMNAALNKEGYFILRDIQTPKDFEIIKEVVKKDKISQSIEELLVSSGAYLHNEVTYEENLSVLRI